MTDHLKSPSLESPHAFFSRAGGVSTGLYKGLNCGPGSRDNPASVLENRRIAAKQLSGSADTPVLSCYQVHGNTAMLATDDWQADRPKADAIVTKTPGLILGILTADCTPVLFEDAEAGVIGAAHAGWKGAASGIVDSTVRLMEAHGAKRNRIKAAVGPTIHQKSYEVDSGFKNRFEEADPSWANFFTSGKDSKHFQFDLPGFVTMRLKSAGIESVWMAGLDTYTSEDHFSYRRTTHRNEPDYGRQLSAIMLKP